MNPTVCYTVGMKLKRLKHKPGSAVQRFGDWRKGEPQVILDSQTWLEVGKPDEIELNIPKKAKGFWNQVNEDLRPFNDEVNRILYGD